MKTKIRFETKQDVFNHVWDHFITNKGPFSLRNDVCVYKDTSNGCIVGICLSDELCEELDAESVGGIQDMLNACSASESKKSAYYLDKIREFFGEEIRNDLDFLVKLQTAHDISSARTTMAPLSRLILEKSLRDIAEFYNLTIPEKME